jgi:hypothetical protein
VTEFTFWGLLSCINILNVVDKVVTEAISVISLIIGLIAIVSALGGAVRGADLEYMEKRDFINILKSDLRKFEILIIVMVATSVLSLLSLLFSSDFLGVLSIVTFLAGLFYMLYVVLKFVSRVVRFAEKVGS